MRAQSLKRRLEKVEGGNGGLGAVHVVGVPACRTKQMHDALIAEALAAQGINAGPDDMVVAMTFVPAPCPIGTETAGGDGPEARP